MTSMLRLVQNDNDPNINLIEKKNHIAKNPHMIKAMALDTVQLIDNLGPNTLKKMMPSISSPNPSS